MAVDYKNGPLIGNIIQEYIISFDVKTVDISLTLSGFQSGYRTEKISMD